MQQKEDQKKVMYIFYSLYIPRNIFIAKQEDGCFIISVTGFMT